MRSLLGILTDGQCGCWERDVLAFVDESGDAGRKLDKGSSRFLTVAVVTFEDPGEALACDRRIERLRQDLNLPAGFEFHFRDNSHRVRLAFLEAVAPFDFFYHAFALNKDPEKLYGPGFQYPDSLYKYACRLVFENAKPYLHDATVVIDESGERRFREELQRYLRRRIREGERQIVRKVKMQRSRGNNLLQLADYVAGVASRTVQRKRGAETYRRFLIPHETSMRIWPQ